MIFIKISKNRFPVFGRSAQPTTVEMWMYARKCAPVIRRLQNGKPSMRRPPHILATTPESFYLLLTSQTWPQAFGNCADADRG